MACGGGGGTWESCPVHPGKAGIVQEVGSWPGAPRSPQLCATRVCCSASACVLQPQTAGVFVRNAPSCTRADPASAQPGQPAPFGAHPWADPAPWVRRCLRGAPSALGYPASALPSLCRYSSGQMVWGAPKLGSCPPCSSADLLERVIDSLYLLVSVIKQSRSVRNLVRAFDSCYCDSRQL